MDQAGHKIKTQALPYVADKAGDAVKAAGQKVKERADKQPLPATVRRDANGTAYADVTSGTGRADDRARGRRESASAAPIAPGERRHTPKGASACQA